MTTYNVEIVVNGKDNASGAFGKVGGALGNMAQIAGGILGAQLFTKIGSAVMGAASDALQSYASFERLGSSLTSMAARELINADASLSMSDAMAKAKGIAADLQGWIQKLAIQSPFTQEDVASSFRLAMAYGFTSEEAQRLTQATIDFAAGSGASSESMNKIALALGQIRAKGKLAGGEVLQLTEAGINVRDILAKSFGVSTEKIIEMQEKGLIPADKAIEAITQSLEKDFGGAAKAQASTFSGLISSLSDIKSVGLREFFTGTFQAIQPYVDQFVTKFSDPAFMAQLKETGARFGDFVKIALEGIPRVIGFFDNLKESISGIFSGGLSGVGGFISTILGALGGLGLGGALLGPMAGLGGVIVTAIGGGILSKAPGILTVVMGNVGKFMFSALLPFLSDLSPKIGGAFFRMFMIGGTAEKSLGKLGLVFAQIGKFLGPILGPLGSFAAAAGPIALLAMAVMGVFGAFQMLKDGELDKFAGPLQSIFANISATFQKMLPTLISLGQTLGGAFATASKELAQKIIPFLVSQLAKFAAWFQENRPLIEQFVSALVGFITNVLIPAVTGLWSVIQPILGGIIDLVLGIVTTIMQIATGDWAGAWQTIQDTVVNVALAIWEALGNFVTWVIDLFTNLYDQLVGHSIIPDMMNAMLNIIKSITTMIIAFWRSSWSTVLLIVSTAWNNMVNTAKNMLANLVTAIKNGLSTVVSAFSSISSSIVAAVQGWISSAISAVTGFATVGAQIATQIVNGLKANVSLVVNYLKNLISNLISNVFGGGGSTGGGGGGGTPTPNIVPSVSADTTKPTGTNKPGASATSSNVTNNYFGPVTFDLTGSQSAVDYLKGVR